MRIGGLFIGVDTQRDTSGLRALAFAGADAEAMHATIADMNTQPGAEEDTVLLTRHGATRPAVRDALSALAARSRITPFDVFVVHVSSHGAPDGALLLADAESDAGTEGLAYAELLRLVDTVETGHVVVALDVCYSGRCAGHQRADADDDTLQRILQGGASANRFVIWAARATERAWEVSEYGHGLLTYALLQGLNGTALAQQGRIRILRWLDEAAEWVSQAAARIHQSQHPGIAAARNDSASLPAQPMGPRRKALAARRQLYPITSDPASLAVYGFTPAMCDAVRRHISGRSLNAMQVRAVERAGALAGHNVLVAAPTASGKTLIGELAALAGVHRRQKTVILLPTRALTNEKWGEFQARFAEPFALRAVRSYGGVADDDDALIRHDFDVAFLTYEKFLAWCLTRPALLDVLGAVVLDEVHLLGDPERGRTVEMILLLLRQRQSTGQQVQLVALSAVLGDRNGLEQWLSAELVTEEEGRPVPLRAGVLSPSGRFEYVDERTGEVRTESLFPALPPVRGERDDETRERVAVAAVRALVTADPDERILAFRSFKPQTRRLATALASLGTFSTGGALQEALAVRGVHDESGAGRLLREILTGGVAFHLSDLDAHERESVERAFRQGDVRAVVATSGLAMGVNTPASTVLIVDTEHFRNGGTVPYTVGEYLNMAGRAGRGLRTTQTRGTAVVIGTNDTDARRLFTTYVKGHPEPLVSQLGTLARTDLLLALLAVRGVMGPVPARELPTLLASTFDGSLHAEHAAWRRQLVGEITVARDELEAAGFLTHDRAAGTLALTVAGLVCGREGIRFDSARRVLDGAAHVVAAGEALDDLALVALAQITCELDAIWAYQNYESLPEWTQQLERQLPTRPGVRAMLRAPEEQMTVARLKRLHAMLEWTKGTPMLDIERTFARVQPKDSASASGVVRAVADRTVDVVRGVAKLVEGRFPTEREALARALLRVRPRLEFGVAAKAMALTTYRLGLTRAEVQALADRDILTFESFAEALESRPDALRPVFGDSRLDRLSSQVQAARPHAAARRQRDERAQLDFYAQLAKVTPQDTL